MQAAVERMNGEKTVTSPDEELKTLPTPTEDLASKGAKKLARQTVTLGEILETSGFIPIH